MGLESPTDDSQVNLKNDHFQGRRYKKKWKNWKKKKKTLDYRYYFYYYHLAQQQQGIQVNPVMNHIEISKIETTSDTGLDLNTIPWGNDE